MDEALRVIETSKMWPTDEAFAFHVRLHVLKQKAAHIREQREAEVARTPTTASATTTSLPGLLYLKSLRGQLHELMALAPPSLHQRGEYRIKPPGGKLGLALRG